MSLFLIICFLIADGLLALLALGWLAIHIAVDVIERMERNEEWKNSHKNNVISTKALCWRCLCAICQKLRILR